MKLLEGIRTSGIALRNVVLGANLASLSLLRHPKHMLGYIAESLFLYKIMSSKRGIPQKSVFEMLPCADTQTVTLGSLKGKEAFFGPLASYTADLISLCLICQIIKPKIIFEIGTLTGYTTLHLALNSSEEARIYTLDLPKHMYTPPRLRTTISDDRHIHRHASLESLYFDAYPEAARRIKRFFGDSAAFDYSEFHGKVDFFFIDGAHSYEYARSDSLNAFQCCHRGSVIAWHDFGRVGVNGVTKCILELSKQHEICSIPGGTLAFCVVD